MFTEQLPYEGLHLSDLEELSWWEKIGDVLPEYSNKQVNKAGILLRDDGIEPPWTDEVAKAFDVVGEWRSWHAYPMRRAYIALQRRAKRIDSKAIASQRLKRLPSIVDKLRRPPATMKLSTMQDIGGCRAIVDDVSKVRQLASVYGHVVKDYLSVPKRSGYRCVHVVERFNPQIAKHERYKGLRIEIQIRSRLQHAWATAVETVDSILLEQKLKLGGGDPDWKRFFALTGSAIALQEDSPIVPDTPNGQRSTCA